MTENIIKQHIPLRHKASDIRYDNISSGIAATDVSGALSALFALSGGSTIIADRELIETKTAVGGETDFTFSGLDSDIDGAYIIEIEWHDNASQIGGAVVYCYVNGDTTDANYQWVHHRGFRGTTHQVLTGAGSPVASSDENADDSGVATVLIQHILTDHVTMDSLIGSAVDAGANSYVGTYSARTLGTVVKITSLVLSVSVVGETFGAGNKLSLYKVRKP